MWAGNVTTVGLTLSVLGWHESVEVRLDSGSCPGMPNVTVSTSHTTQDFKTWDTKSSDTFVVENPSKASERWRFGLSGLEPGCCTEMKASGDALDARYCTFAEKPKASSDGSRVTRIAIAGCDRFDTAYDDDMQVYAAIADLRPDLLLHLGDMHYRDIGSTEHPMAGSSRSLDLIGSAIEQVLSRPSRQALLRSVPMAYVYNDHDSGFNNADSRNYLRDDVGKVYRAVVPHYPLSANSTASGPVFQALTVHGVRVLLLDVNYDSEPWAERRISEAQMAWLRKELSPSSRQRWKLVVLATIEPLAIWGSDAQRVEILRLLEGATNVVQVSADAHMAAVDSGANNGGLVSLVAGPLANVASKKGIRSDVGCLGYAMVANNQQFGMLELREKQQDGELELSVQALRVDRAFATAGDATGDMIVLEHRAKLPLPPISALAFGWQTSADKCSLPLMPAGDYAAVLACSLLLTALLALASSRIPLHDARKKRTAKLRWLPTFQLHSDCCCFAPACCWLLPSLLLAVAAIGALLNIRLGARNVDHLNMTGGLGLTLLATVSGVCLPLLAFLHLRRRRNIPWPCDVCVHWKWPCSSRCKRWQRRAREDVDISAMGVACVGAAGGGFEEGEEATDYILREDDEGAQSAQSSRRVGSS